MKIHVICIVLLLSCLTITAQTNYYNITKTFHENEYTYQCDIVAVSQYVTLYNKENKFVHIDQIDKTTGNQMSIDYKKQQLEDNSWAKAKCLSIVDDSFSDAEKQRVRERSRLLTILLYIDSNTGKVIDVVYNFVSVTPYATIPISVYRRIEIEIKKTFGLFLLKKGKNGIISVVGMA